MDIHEGRPIVSVDRPACSGSRTCSCSSSVTPVPGHKSSAAAQGVQREGYEGHSAVVADDAPRTSRYEVPVCILIFRLVADIYSVSQELGCPPDLDTVQMEIRQQPTAQRQGKCSPRGLRGSLVEPRLPSSFGGVGQGKKSGGFRKMFGTLLNRAKPFPDMEPLRRTVRRSECNDIQ